MRQYTLVDADTHNIYPKDMFKKWLPSKYQERAPRVVANADKDGGEGWLLDPSQPPEPLGLTFGAGKRYEDMRWTGSTYEDIRPGAWDGKSRIADMDYDGIDAQVVYSDNRTIGQVLAFKDAEYQNACIRAYNDWLFQDFCAVDSQRLIGLTLTPNTGIESSLAEYKYGAKMGARGVLIRNWPSSKPGFTPDDERFLATCAADGTPVEIHIGFSSGGSGVLSFSRKAQAAGGVGSMGRIIPIITELIYEGVFDRLPNLKIAAVEVGAGWLPYALEQLDTLYWRNRHWAKIQLKKLPSQYWYTNWSITFVEDQYALRNVEAIGVDNLMWSTDYPHNACDWPYSRKVLGNNVQGASQEVRAKIQGLNCARWYGLV